MLIGYARVSTEDQHLYMQEDALKSAGCEEIYSDVASGVKTARPGLHSALSCLRKGDTFGSWFSLRFRGSYFIFLIKEMVRNII